LCSCSIRFLCMSTGLGIRKGMTCCGFRIGIRKGMVKESARSVVACGRKDKWQCRNFVLLCMMDLVRPDRECREGCFLCMMDLVRPDRECREGCFLCMLGKTQGQF
jgi:hypothetical protein